MPSVLENEGHKQDENEEIAKEEEAEDGLNPIDVVNRTSLRLQELEEANETLKA